MDKKGIEKDMRAFTGSGFITKRRFADYMGVKDARYVSKYLEGLDRASGQYYFIPDVAESIAKIDSLMR